MFSYKNGFFFDVPKPLQYFEKNLSSFSQSVLDFIENKSVMLKKRAVFTLSIPSDVRHEEALKRFVEWYNHFFKNDNRYIVEIRLFSNEIELIVGFDKPEDLEIKATVQYEDINHYHHIQLYLKKLIGVKPDFNEMSFKVLELPYRKLNFARKAEVVDVLKLALGESNEVERESVLISRYGKLIGKLKHIREQLAKENGLGVSEVTINVTDLIEKTKVRRFEYFDEIINLAQVIYKLLPSALVYLFVNPDENEPGNQEWTMKMRFRDIDLADGTSTRLLKASVFDEKLKELISKYMETE